MRALEDENRNLRRRVTELEAESENAFLKHELEELQHVVKRNEVMPRRAAPP